MIMEVQNITEIIMKNARRFILFGVHKLSICITVWGEVIGSFEDFGRNK